MQELECPNGLARNKLSQSWGTIEYGYVLRQLNAFQPQTVLDVGSGTRALPSLLATCGFVVTATDNVRDYWPQGMINRHWHTVDDDIRSSHLTEHVAAMQEMLRLTRPGGHRLITTPYNESLNGWLAGACAAELVDQEYWRCFTGDLWTFGELLRPSVRAFGTAEIHQLTCLSIRRK